MTDANLPAVFDVAIIGGGPGGYVAAIRAAQEGLTVALIDRGPLGGTCLNWGCIPTKALHHTAEVWRTVHDAGTFGVTVGPATLDFATVMAHKDAVVRTMVRGIDTLMQGNKIEVLRGVGCLLTATQPHRIAVSDIDGGSREITARNVIIATGSAPSMIPIPGLDLPGVVTSDGILSLTAQPKRLAVIGGGIIGMEFATIFAALGTTVSVVERLPNILTGVEPEMIRRAIPMYRKMGLAITVDASVEEVTWGDDDDLAVHYRTANGKQSVEADAVLVAVGRTPYTEGAWAPDVPLEKDRRAVKVDTHLRTNLPGVYSIGDVALMPQLAHTASMQGEIVVENIKGHDAQYDPSVVPNCVFTLPEISGVGLTEEQARERFGSDVRTSVFPFAAIARAQILGEPAGVVKLVCGASGNLLGAHIIGPRASDLIAELALALQLGASAADIARTIHAHPTLPEAIHEAALGIVHGRPVHAL
ncbi:MAG: dihydrolipoyl dehydrogenase, partial [Chloroflexota bacterium]|nr:dihydrolipoyl dehydrogenase [Chloroflexota bacterium]